MPLWLRVFLGALAVLIGAVSLFVSLTFLQSYGQTDAQRYTYAAIAVACFGIKFAFPAAAVYSQRGRDPILWSAVVVAILIDGLCAFGYAELTRGGKTSSATIEASAYSRQAKEVDRARAELDAYAGALSTPEAEAALKAARAVAGQCTGRRAAVDVCKTVTTAEQDLARAKERAARELRYRNEKLKFDTMREVDPTRADPQAAAVEKIIKEIFKVEGAGVFAVYIFSILILLITELAGPYSAYLAMQPSAAKRPSPASRPSDPTVDALRAVLDGRVVAPGVTVAGRTLTGSQRALGLACGLSASGAGVALRRLASSGYLSLTTGAGGTTIELLS